MKVGVVSLYAPPHFGGAEGYVYRMVKSLDVRGIDACLITTTQKREDRDNGDDDLILRLGDKMFTWTVKRNVGNGLIWFLPMCEKMIIHILLSIVQSPMLIIHLASDFSLVYLLSRI